MPVLLRTDRQGDRLRVIASGPFDLPHTGSIERAIADVEHSVEDRLPVDVDLTDAAPVDGAGASLLAGLLDRLEARGHHTDVLQGAGADAAALLALARKTHTRPPPSPRSPGLLARVGQTAATIPGALSHAFDFAGRSAVALPRAAVAPRSVDWRALPGLLQQIGADALPVVAAANLLIGLIIGFLGVSQLGRFGASAYVPELVVVTQFRELGPLVTAIVIAGRSGAGLASELATMTVSEEIDALRTMGFDPMRWLVVPRCLALVIAMPLLTWIGDILALAGGLAATTATSSLTPRAYVIATADAITATHFLIGLVKSPFLALAIGLIACGQGLAAHGGSAAVGERTTAAVVTAILGVIAISALFTLFVALMGL